MRKKVGIVYKMIFTNIISSILLSMLPPVLGSDLYYRQCEPIRIDLCRNIGYNETSMPNLVGNELQNEVEYTLQTFTPLIEYVCSTQLKLFLCAAYVPMCTPKVPVPIGPCRSLCESVRSHCHPVLQGFGYPWPPALECNRFPKENSQDSMCMEGPDEPDGVSSNQEILPIDKLPNTKYDLECPSFSKLYVKLHRLGRCASLCNANILFTDNEKHIAEIWTNTWTYAGLATCFLAVLCLISDQGNNRKKHAKCTNNLCSLVWCHTMVTIGWTIRFILGRTATACGFDPQLPNVSLLLVDGLSNISCASNFFLRYYFGMASCAWWSMLCLGWHRNVRRRNPGSLENIVLGTVYHRPDTGVLNRGTHDSKIATDITSSHLVRFLAWGLPAFQTVAVIVMRLVDADELLGACFVGNQSDRGLQIFVATPLFCYWIFGAMNLSSGFLVHRRSKGTLCSINSSPLHLIQPKSVISGLFLFVYCIPLGVLLLTVIYEFAKIDDWLNLSPYISSDSSSTPMWPFLMRVFIELTLSIYCSAWIIGPKMFALYQRQFKLLPKQQQAFPSISPLFHKRGPSHVQLSSNVPSCRSVHQPSSCQSLPLTNKTEPSIFSTKSLKHNTTYNHRASKLPYDCHIVAKNLNISNKRTQSRIQCTNQFGNETIL